MSFAVRQTWKPRNIHLTPVGTEDEQAYFNPEEAQNIINTIKQFTQKSSHANIMTAGEMREVLRGSSINPEINPMNKTSVDNMVRINEENENNRWDVTSTSDPKKEQAPYGFSSGSAYKATTAIHGSKMENELKKELDVIRARYRAERKAALDNADDTEEKILIGDDPFEIDLSEEKDDIPDEVAQQVAKITGRFSHSTRAAEANKKQSKALPVKDNELSSSSRVMSYSYPARASMIRGFQHRQGGTSGPSVRRTPMGCIDAF